MHKSTQVGIFLAVLELVRHHYVQSEQNELFGEIWVFPGTNSESPMNLSEVDGYEHSQAG